MAVPSKLNCIPKIVSPLLTIHGRTGWIRLTDPPLSAQNLTPPPSDSIPVGSRDPLKFLPEQELDHELKHKSVKNFWPLKFLAPSPPRVSISLVFYQIHILLTKLSLKYNPYTQINVLKCTFLVIPSPFFKLPHWYTPLVLTPPLSTQNPTPLLEIFLTPPPHTTNPPPSYGGNH